MALLNAIHDHRIEPDTNKLQEEQSQSDDKVASLYKEISDIESKPIELKKISCGDVSAMMKTLKQKINKKQIEEMLWEVDEDLDGCINWAEFRLMFTRNAIDRTGLEMSKMFNLTQFLIYDSFEKGKVYIIKKD